MKPYPLLFQPMFKAKVWGGRALERLGKRLPPGETIGESWELADLPPSIKDGRSTIANGELSGQTLHAALKKHGEWIMGGAMPREGGEPAFPLLIKFLDARQNLSVQVHPSAEYVQRHPEAHLKSEAWVVLDAEPGAVIYNGLRRGVTREAFAEHIRTGAVVDDLIAMPARVGDCHYLPSGTCHALGAGIVVAEVQTPSDTTFRVYDWGRVGVGRELHIDQALQCIDFSGTPQRLPRLPGPNTADGVTTTTLTRTDYFEIERVDAEAGASFEIVTQNLPQVWMVLEGDGRMKGSFAPALNLRPGVTALVPAAARDWRGRFESPARLLIVRLPSPLRNMLA